MKIVKLGSIEHIEHLRQDRERICFPIVNRGKLWYNRLSIAQLTELDRWYQKWLDVTETLEVPEQPEWLNNKLIEEEII